MSEPKKNQGGGRVQEPAKIDRGNSAGLFSQNNAILFVNDLLENMSDAFIATDMDFSITQWNNAARIIYGWISDEVLGQSMDDIIPTEYVSDNRETVLQRVMTNGIWSCRVIQARKDGRKISIFAAVSLVKDELGKATGLAAVNREIPDEKQAEGRFRLAVESAPNAILMVDEDGKIVLVNSQAETSNRLKQGNFQNV